MNSFYSVIISLFICNFIFFPVPIKAMPLSSLIQKALENKTFENFKLEDAISSRNIYIYLGNYDTTIMGDASYSYDGREMGNVFIPNTQYAEVALGLEKKTITGTTITLKAVGSYADLSYLQDTIPDITYKEALVELSLTQAILNNGFGVQDRNNLKIASQKRYIEALRVLDRTEQVVYDTITLYWDLLAAHSAMITQREGLKNARALYENNLNKSEQGLTEKRTLYALESDVLTAKKELNDTAFHYYSTATKMASFLNMTLKEIYKIKGQEQELLARMVASINKKSVELSTIRAYQIARLDAEIARIALNNTMDSLKPRLSAYTTIKSNGLDDNAQSAISDSLELDTTAWTMGISVRTPVSGKTGRLKQENAKDRVRYQDNQKQLIEADLNYGLTHYRKDMKRCKDALDISTEILSLQQKKYKEDLFFFKTARLDIDRFLQSKEAYLQARLQVIYAKTAYAKAINTYQRFSNVLLANVFMMAEVVEGGR